MKRNLIALIGATLIIFIWQMLSWMALHIHDDVGKYTPAEKELIEVLSNKLPESGMYMMPGTDPSKPATMEEMEIRSKEWEGKPYALVFYHTQFKGMQGSTMALGFVFNMMAVLIAIFIVNTAIRGGATFGKCFVLVLSLSVFTIFQSVMLNWNWWEFPWHFIKGELIDGIAGWTLCGLFLSWYLGKGRTAIAN
jgi:hypothetical protein